MKTKLNKLNQLATLAKRQASKTAAVASAAVVMTGSAHAELPAAVSTAITDAGTNLALAATSIIAGLAAFWGLRALGKKLGLWAN